MGCKDTDIFLTSKYFLHFFQLFSQNTPNEGKKSEKLPDFIYDDSLPESSGLSRIGKPDDRTFCNNYI